MKTSNQIFQYMLFVFCFLLTGNHVNAQATYQRLFTDQTLYSSNWVTGVCELSSQKVAVFGFYTFPGNSQGQLSLFLIDSQGNKISSNAFVDATGHSDPAYGFVNPTKDGGAVCGYGYFGNGVGGELIVKIDSLGAIQWSTLLADSIGSNFITIRQLNNGNFVSVSNISRSVNNITRYGNFISLLSPSGSLLSSAFYYNDTADVYTKDIIETPDGDIYISGAINLICAQGIMLLKFSNSLQPIWSKVYEDTNLATWLYSYYRFNKHNLIYLDGNLYLGFENRAPAISWLYGNPVLMKMDTAGQVIWCNEYDRPEIEIINEVIAGNNGRILMLSEISPDSGPIRNGLTQVDTSGVVLYAAFQSTPLDNFMAVSAGKSQDGGYYLSCAFNAGTGGYGQFYILKTDSLLSMNCHSQPATFNVLPTSMISSDFLMNTLPGWSQYPITLTPVPILTTDQDFCQATSVGSINEETELLVFPNPVKDDFIYLDFENAFHSQLQVNIYDATGRLVISEYISPGNSKTEISISGLKNGLYFVSIKSDNSFLHQTFAVMR